jgi:hypothetical protein
LTFGKGSESVRPHYFRVKDVEYQLDDPSGQVGVLVEEENPFQPWP